mmetsp:Transcript_19293/g.38544  ORF Transcript_19293/g.38544 Transcript_19293/m.38544 type:complete len:271 (-) Transcript_19293:16-828(-)
MAADDATPPPDLFRRDSNILRSANEPSVDELTEQMAGLDTGFISERNAIYEAAFADHPVSVGKAVSKKEREETKQNASTLVYGEINFEAFALAMEKVKHRYGRPNEYHSGAEGIMQAPGGVFYDIGSGTGKPVIAAIVLHNFARAIGIEYLEGLHVTSLEVLQRWDSEVRYQLDYENPTEVEFIHGDATDFEVKDWSDGDVLFANSTCFDAPLMEAIAARAASLKKGTFFITLTKRLPSDHFEVLEHEVHQMSWGSATVYIQQKTTDPAY